MELKEAHDLMKKECGIEVGDTVKVLRAAKSLEMGWTGDWSYWMDKCVGHEYEVVKDYNNASCNGIELSCEWAFPFFVLEIVKKKSKKKTVTLELTEEQLEKIKPFLKE